MSPRFRVIVASDVRIPRRMLDINGQSEAYCLETNRMSFVP